MQAWRISLVAATTGPLLQYGGAYIREHPDVRILYRRTATGLAVSAQTKAIAGPIVSAAFNSSYHDWLKSEYTTPAAPSPIPVSLVPDRGSLGNQIESINGLANFISDSDIRGQSGSSSATATSARTTATRRPTTS